MEQLSQQELDNKIHSFLNERFSAHQSISKIQLSENKQSVVSRVKNIAKKIHTPRVVSSQSVLHI